MLGSLLPLLSAGHAVSPRGFWFSWPNEPLLSVGLFLAAAFYVLGWRRLARQAPGVSGPTWRLWCFASGLLALGLSLLSPIAVYSEQLFFMHMIQHLLLLLIAPPLLWLGAPLLPTLWALPADWRRVVGRRLAPARPLTGWATC